MNSKSTYLRAKIGGVGGAPLADGTELETGDLTAEQEKLAAAWPDWGASPSVPWAGPWGRKACLRGNPSG